MRKEKCNYREIWQILAIIVTVLLMASITLMTMPVQPVKAQVALTPEVALRYPEQIRDSGVPLPPGVTPSLTLDTHPFLSFRPNPVGLGQTIIVNIWLTPALYPSRYHEGYTVTITKPDGTKDTIVKDSYFADATAWFDYTVDQVGTWTLKFDFPGGYYPSGIYCRPGSEAPPGITGVGAGTTTDRYWNFTESVYYKPSSTPEQQLVV